MSFCQAQHLGAKAMAPSQTQSVVFNAFEKRLILPATRTMTSRSFLISRANSATTGNTHPQKKSGTNCEASRRCTPACHTSVWPSWAAFSGLATAKTNLNQVSCMVACGIKTRQNVVAWHHSVLLSMNHQLKPRRLSFHCD